MPSSEVVRYAREWVADCEWVETAEELAELSDAAIVDELRALLRQARGAD